MTGRYFCLQALGRLLLLAMIMSLGTAAFAAGLPLGAQPWAYSSLTYRREIQLPPDPARSRSNVPLILDLKQLGTVDLATLKVDEITNSPAVACPVAAYAQPSGRDPRAYWTASGTTAAGATRRFLVYYNKLSAAPAYAFNWSRAGASFGTYSVSSSSPYSYNLKGDRISFMTTARKVNSTGDAQHAVFYEQNTDLFRCMDTQNGFNPLRGIRYSYAFAGEQFTTANNFNVSGSERFFDAIKWDRNGPSAAMNAHYTISDPIAHQVEVTYRVFTGQPLLEFSLTATPKSGPPLEFAPDVFSSRQFYWNKSVFSPTRHINDLGKDSSLSSENSIKNYIIIADSSGKATGFFTFKPSEKQNYYSNSQAFWEMLHDGSEKGSIYVYYAVGKVDELKTLFDSMKRGYPLGEEQQQRYNIVQPTDGATFIMGEAISAAVAGPNLGSDLTLRVDYPDGSSQNFKYASLANGSASFNLGTVGTTSKFGSWKLTATSGGISRTHTIVVRNPDHPRVLFTAGELAKIKARWATDSRYQSHILFHESSKANGALTSTPPPATLKGGMRDYGRDLANLSGALLMDPGNSAAPAWRSRMWSNFRTMMAWPQWDPIGNGSSYFSSDDVERGEVLLELTCVYDWFYSDLSVADRRKYAELLARYGDAILNTGYAPPYPFKSANYNDIDNSRAVSMAAALSGVERAVANEIPDARRALWRSRLDGNFATLKRTLCSDGSYNAGQSYHGLLLWYIFYWSESRRLNGDSSLYSSVPWFREMPNYVLYGMMPGRVGNFGGLMPFGNCGQAPYYSLQTDLSIVGLRGGNRVAQWVSENLDYSRVEPFQAVWQDYSLPETYPSQLPNWHYFPRRGIFVYRSSWDNDAMYFATKCGEFWGGHEHADTGTFVIHRNGYPYIAAPHYLEEPGVNDENLLVANGKTPLGRKAGTTYATSVPPENWGKTLRALGSPDYFNVLQNPTPSYEDGANLKSYNREFVGFKDLIVLRDTITASAASTLQLNFHGYQTDPQTEAGTPYDPQQYPNVQIFQSVNTSRIRLYPNKTATPAEWMTILNVSRSPWTTSIGPWKLATQTIPGYTTTGDHPKNSNADVLTRGGQLARTLSGATAGSALQVFHFRADAYNSRAWSSAVADDGVVIYYNTTTDDRLKVVWPKGGKMTNVTGAEGLTVTGAMAMRNYENKDFGGRDLTYLRDDSAKGEKTVLLSATTPVTLVSKTASGLVGSAWIACNAASQVTLYCTKVFQVATFNGAAVTFSGSGMQKTFSIPATPQGGELVLKMTNSSSNAARNWESYE